METCSEVSGCVTAGTTSSASSWMNPPPPAFPSARCSLRYAEFAYGSSTVSVNRLPCASFSRERTSDVIWPAVLYALDPTTGMCSPGRQAFLPVHCSLARFQRGQTGMSVLLRSFLRQRRFLQISRDADNGVNQRGGSAYAERRSHSRLQVKMLRINSYGRESGEDAAGGAADCRGEQSFEPQLDSCECHMDARSIPLGHCYKGLLVKCRHRVIQNVICPSFVVAIHALFALVQVGATFNARRLPRPFNGPGNVLRDRRRELEEFAASAFERETMFVFAARRVRPERGDADSVLALDGLCVPGAG